MVVRIVFLIILFGRNVIIACQAQHKCSHSCGSSCSNTGDNQCTLSFSHNICKQTCIGVNCDLICDGQDCEQTCSNANEKCRLTCNGQNCTQTCNGGDCCLECNGGHCTQTCNKGVCNLKCNKENCQQEWLQDCTLKSHGKKCTQHRSGLNNGGSCQTDCSVASHANRCKQHCGHQKPQCTQYFITITEAPTAISEHLDTSTGKPLSQTTPVLSSLSSSSRTITPSSSVTTAKTTTSVILQSSSASSSSPSLKSLSSKSTLSVAPSVTASTPSTSSSSSAALSSSPSGSSSSSSLTTSASVAPSVTVSTTSPSATASMRSSSMAGISEIATVIPSLASSTTASKDTGDKSQNIPQTEELVKNSISALNRVDPKEETSLQDAVNLLENTTEQLGNISHLITEQDREGSIFKVVAAFEEFSLKYGHYHLNESVPQLSITHSRLILRIQRFFHRDARDFILKGPEKHTDFINFSSRNFLNNGSLLVGVLYKDLHELLQSNPSNNDAPKSNKRLNTIIMAATMDPKPEKLQQNITLKFSNLKVAEGKRYCVFWSDYNEGNPDGWSGKGCHVVRSKSSSGQTECTCNHMTHFAVLFDYGDNLEITKTDEKILRILTYVGLALSIIGIILTILFYAYFTDVHQPLSQIRISLASSLGAGKVIFLVGINATENTGACVAVAALMQYFFMAAFCWMLVEGIYLYLFVVKVYNINNKMTMYYVISWGFPAVMVAISLSIASGKNGIQSFVSEEHCWMSSDNNLIWIFVAFAVIVEAVNILILARVIKEMTTMQSTGENHTRQIRLGIKACAVLIPLFGVTWLFGLLLRLHKAFVYIFTILNSAEGFLIFLLHCLRNSQIKERFRRRMNAVFPISSANDVNSTKKTSQFNQSDVGISKAMELHSFRDSGFELE